MVKLITFPRQAFAIGKTLIVAVTGALVGLIAVKEGISPLPLAGKPIVGLLLFHKKTVPITGPLKFTALVAVPLHKDWLTGCTRVGVGFT